MKEPDLVGHLGKAWLVDLDAACKRAGKLKSESCALDQWIVEASWAHPIWSHYWVSLMHLRSIPNTPDAMIYLEGATHEIGVVAIDPTHSVEAMVAGGPIFSLDPSNFGAQFIEPDDAAANKRIRVAVELICEGKLSPDTDFIGQWIALFGDNMIKKKP